MPFETRQFSFGFTTSNPFNAVYKIVDLNADGSPDILFFPNDLNATALQTFPLGALLNDGSGRFTNGAASVLPASVATASATDVLVGDFNGDGRVNLYVAAIGLDSGNFPGTQNLLLFAAPGGGFTNATSRLPQVSDFTESAATADIDGDGDLDILAMNIFGGTPPTGPLTAPYFLINNGSGEFTRADDRLPAAVTARVQTDKFTAVGFLDANGDGRPDLFLGTHGDGAQNSKILLNDGTGRFTTEILTPPPLPSGQYTINDVLVTDLSGDGRPDMVLSMSVQGLMRGRLQLLVNEGGGQFSDRTAAYLVDATMPQAPESVQTADVNGDGQLDLIVRSGTTKPVYLNDGQGHFVNLPQSYLGVADIFHRAGAADFNGDGRLDFIVETFQAVIKLQLEPARSQFGTAQEDALLGGGLADTLAGGSGGDVLFGGAGDDSLIGEDGFDRLVGGRGGDTLLGGAGGDTITDQDGPNYLRGDEGDDSIVGGAGFNDINGNMGNDTVLAGSGDSWAVGGRDNDSLMGGSGQNLVYGNLGDDTCDGGDAADIVRGGQGSDLCLGGAGDDFLSGDRGDDTLTGGAGADTFNTFSETGLDRVTDFNLAQGDRVQLAPGTQFTVSQVGADTVISMTGGGQMVLVGVQMASLTSGWIFGA